MTANVFCTARDEVRAARLLDELQEAGFAMHQLSMVVPEHAVPGGVFPLERADADESKCTPSHQSPVSEALRRLSHTVLSRYPKIGLCAGAGPLALQLSAAAKANIDDLVSDLTRAGVPRGDLYAQRISEARILLSVHCACIEETDRVRMVLTRAGAEDLLITGAASSRDAAHTSYNLPHAA